MEVFNNVQITEIDDDDSDNGFVYIPSESEHDEDFDEVQSQRLLPIATDTPILQAMLLSPLPAPTSVSLQSKSPPAGDPPTVEDGIPAEKSSLSQTPDLTEHGDESSREAPPSPPSPWSPAPQDAEQQLAVAIQKMELDIDDTHTLFYEGDFDSAYNLEVDHGDHRPFDDMEPDGGGIECEEEVVDQIIVQDDNEIEYDGTIDDTIGEAPKTPDTIQFSEELVSEPSENPMVVFPSAELSPDREHLVSEPSENSMVVIPSAELSPDREPLIKQEPEMLLPDSPLPSGDEEESEKSPEMIKNEEQAEPSPGESELSPGEAGPSPGESEPSPAEAEPSPGEANEDEVPTGAMEEDVNEKPDQPDEDELCNESQLSVFDDHDYLRESLSAVPNEVPDRETSFRIHLGTVSEQINSYLLDEKPKDNLFESVEALLAFKSDDQPQEETPQLVPVAPLDEEIQRLKAFGVEIATLVQRLEDLQKEDETERPTDVYKLLEGVTFSCNMLKQKCGIMKTVETQYESQRGERRKMNQAAKIDILAEISSSDDETVDFEAEKTEKVEENGMEMSVDKDEDVEMIVDTPEVDRDPLELEKNEEEEPKETLLEDMDEKEAPKERSKSPEVMPPEVNETKEDKVQNDSNKPAETEEEAEAVAEEKDDKEKSPTPVESIEITPDIPNLDDGSSLSPPLTDDEEESKENKRPEDKAAENDLSDDEIANLTDISSLLQKKPEREPKLASAKKPKKKPRQKETVSASSVVNGTESAPESDSSDSDEPTEEEYLKRLNEREKAALLNSSSDEDYSDADDDQESAAGSDVASNAGSDDMDRLLNQLIEEELAKVSSKDDESAAKGKTERPKQAPDATKSDAEEGDKSPGRKSEEKTEAEGDEALDLSMFTTQREKINNSLDIAEEELAAADAAAAAASSNEPSTAIGTSVITSVGNVSSPKPPTPTPIDCISLSSDSDDESDVASVEAPTKRSRLRPMLSDKELAESTQEAQRDERERLHRLKVKRDSMSQTLSQLPESERRVEDSLILDYDTKAKEFIRVHPHIVQRLKPHQREGVKFMYDNIYGCVDDIEKHPGSGCILAHCMGLGKTLQLIALLSTVIRYPRLKTTKVLIICPKSTILNWSEEFETWLKGIPNVTKLKVFCFEDNATVHDKIKILQEWHSSNGKRAGCLLVGYEAFRQLVFYDASKPGRNGAPPPKDSKQIMDTIDRTLIKPGADLIVCDEGHCIKNPKSATNRAVTAIHTLRRIVLTGTPIQNNLREYYCMVNFVKPAFLGTEKEFNNMYANPIKMGQCRDSSKQDIRNMKHRSYVLHKKLSPFVQRKEAAILREFLPEKYEYVLYIPLTEAQQRLYEHFLARNPYQGANGGKNLLPDYTFLRKIWTHPKVLETAYATARLNRDKKQQKLLEKKLKRLAEMEDEDVPDDVLDVGTETRSVLDDWWRKYVSREELESLGTSNKLLVMLEILKLSWNMGEKLLIFSAFVAVLDVVEYFLSRWFGDQNIPWMRNSQYYRLDGKTSKVDRHKLITNFNRADNTRVKCFLISAKAGGQGINLTGANRVIILDTSWNPSSDQQNIFRIYRLGQKKPCFVYRLLAIGTMEEKVYSRSVTKQAMSFRVVDEQQIDRHFSNAELAELYSFTPVDYDRMETPIVPKDPLLAHMLTNSRKQIFKYLEHDSLLESKDDEELTEQEKREAWEQYELEQRNQNRPPLQLQFEQQAQAQPQFNPFLQRLGLDQPPNFGALPPFSNYGSGFGGFGFPASSAYGFDGPSTMPPLGSPYGMPPQNPLLAGGLDNMSPLGNLSSLYGPPNQMQPRSGANAISPPISTPRSSPSTLANLLESAPSAMYRNPAVTVPKSMHQPSTSRPPGHHHRPGPKSKTQSTARLPPPPPNRHVPQQMKPPAPAPMMSRPKTTQQQMLQQQQQHQRQPLSVQSNVKSVPTTSSAAAASPSSSNPYSRQKKTPIDEFSTFIQKSSRPTVATTIPAPPPAEPEIISIPDDINERVNPVKVDPNKIRKNLNMGIVYPKKDTGTPIHLPDEISINRISKVNPTGEPPTTRAIPTPQLGSSITVSKVTTKTPRGGQSISVVGGSGRSAITQIRNLQLGNQVQITPITGGHKGQATVNRLPTTNRMMPGTGGASSSRQQPQQQHFSSGVVLSKVTNNPPMQRTTQQQQHHKRPSTEQQQPAGDQRAKMARVTSNLSIPIRKP